MNKNRMKQIKAAYTILESLKYTFEEIRDDEETAYDNLPESIQESDRGEAMQENVDVLDDVCNSLDEAFDRLGDLM